MKGSWQFFLLASVVVFVHAAPDTSKEEKEKEKEIEDLKHKVKKLKEQIDQLNKQACQSDETATYLCDPHESFLELSKCLCKPGVHQQVKAYTKKEFYHEFNYEPVVALGINQLHLLCGANFETSAKSENKKYFNHELVSNKHNGVIGVGTDYFACPMALNYKSKY